MLKHSLVSFPADNYFSIRCSNPQRGEGENAEVGAPDAFKLRERERVFAETALDSVAGAVEILNEPVLIPGKAGGVGRVLVGVAAHGGEPLGERAAALRLEI